MEQLLDHCTAVITGAGRGIGRAIALAYAREGARLFLAARTERELAETAAACREEGATVQPVVTDVAESNQVRDLVGRAVNEAGQVDILVNPAGIYGPIGPTADVDVEAWTDAVRVNLFGPLYLCRALLPHMLQRRQGKIVLLGGGGATAPLPNFSSYAASKAAVARLADTLAEEVKAFNIQVNVIAPAWWIPGCRTMSWWPAIAPVRSSKRSRKLEIQARVPCPRRSQRAWPYSWRRRLRQAHRQARGRAL